MTKMFIVLAGAAVLLTACATRAGVERKVAADGAVAAPAESAPPIRRQYYDGQAGRYYYFDRERGGYFWEDGGPRG